MEEEFQASLDYPYRTTATRNAEEWSKRQEKYQNSSRYCGSGFYFNIESHKLVRSSCKMFSCSNCRDKKVRNILDKTTKYAMTFDLTRFLTFTLGGVNRRSYVSPVESFSYMMAKFVEFRILYKREFGENLDYICFPRSHKDGYCHLHILVNKYIPKSWLNDVMARIQLGNCNIKYVDAHRVGGYLHAYLNKKIHEWYLPKGKRHYTTAGSVELERFEPVDFWVYIDVGVGGTKYAEVNCVHVNIDWWTKYPPPFEFLLSEFYSNLHADN